MYISTLNIFKQCLTVYKYILFIHTSVHTCHNHKKDNHDLHCSNAVQRPYSMGLIPHNICLSKNTDYITSPRANHVFSIHASPPHVPASAYSPVTAYASATAHSPAVCPAACLPKHAAPRPKD